MYSWLMLLRPCNCSVRKSLGSYVDDLSTAIRRNIEHKGSSAVSDRLELLLASLVAMAINQRDTVVGRSLIRFYISNSWMTDKEDNRLSSIFRL